MRFGCKTNSNHHILTVDGISENFCTKHIYKLTHLKLAVLVHTFTIETILVFRIILVFSVVLFLILTINLLHRMVVRLYRGGIYTRKKAYLAKFSTLVSKSNHSFTASNFFMHIFNR